MAKDDGATGYKLLGTLAAVAAAFVTKQLLSQVWKRVFGHEPPDKPESLDVELGEALGWAIASGTAVGVARLMAQRQVAATWQRANGEVPIDTGGSRS
jgi:hypothetical protein